MKYLFLTIALTALIAAPVVEARACQKASCPHEKGAAAHAEKGCMKQAGATKTVTNIDNGVKITLASDDPKVVTLVQEETATHPKPGCDADCPMHAEGVTRTIEKTATGVVITVTAADAALAKKLQEHAAAMCDKPCPHKAAGDGKGKAVGQECPHAKSGAK